MTQDTPATEQVVDLDAGALVPAPENVATADDPAQPKTDDAIIDPAADAGADKDETDEVGDKPKRRSGYQRMKSNWLRAENEKAALREKLEAAEKGGAIADADLPKPADYPQGEWDSGYLSDLAAAKAAKKIGKQLEERDQRDTNNRVAEHQNEATQQFLERVDEVKPRLPNFDKVMDTFEKNGGKFAHHVIEEIRDSEKGPVLAYQLAQNPGLVAELNAMSPRDAAREIGRIEAKASLPKPRTQTQAPAPLTTLKGGASPSITLENASMADYVKIRKADKD